MNDYKHKFENFKKAFSKLEEGIDRYIPTDDLMRDGLIQRFEFTFEIAWKTLKSIFEDEGLKGLNSPKMVLRETFAAEMIKDEELWLSMLNDRNSTTHIYNEEMAQKICNNIHTKYIDAFSNLIKEINNRHISG